MTEATREKCVHDPGRPSKAEIAAHKLTRCPYRLGCEHCVRGQAVGTPHRCGAAEDKESEIPRVILDYAFLQQEMVREALEDSGEGAAEDRAAAGVERLTVKMAVMIETECNSIWAYAVESKGTLTEQ